MSKISVDLKALTFDQAQCIFTGINEALRKLTKLAEFLVEAVIARLELDEDSGSYVIVRIVMIDNLYNKFDDEFRIDLVSCSSLEDSVMSSTVEKIKLMATQRVNKLNEASKKMFEIVKTNDAT